jgi:prolyl oligopeptidase
VFLICGVLLSHADAEEPWHYPVTRRVDQVDTYFGVPVADPYRWLEADVRQSPEVAAWVAAENKLTSSYLAAIPARNRIRRRLAELWNFARYGLPEKNGARYFFAKNDGLQNQSVLYVTESLESPPRLLLDPNGWTKDGTMALEKFSPSNDGRRLAYCVAEAGSDWSNWHVLDVDSGKLLADELKWTKFTDAAWTKDDRGFYYGRYEEPRRGSEFQARNFNHKIYYHRLGTAQAEDALVYYRPEHPEWSYMAGVSDDGRYLVITTYRGTDEKFRITVKDLRRPDAGFVELVDNFDHEYSFLGNQGSTLLFKTDLNAPRRRVIAVDLERPQPEHWREIIPQAAETLQHVGWVGGRLIASYLKDVRPQVKLFSPQGKFLREVEFPGIGAVEGFGGKQSDSETFYMFSSFAEPPSVYHYDLASGASRLVWRPQLKFRPEDYAVEQVFYRSKDGTRIPMFLAHKRGLAANAAVPALLYGYGGFNISLPPRFSVGWLVWMEMGGLLAVPNLRGGGEYGEAWHRAGTKLQKQNVFDDFIAAAQWLIDHHYTRPDKLAIQGGSNGGLLVGAALTQRPELFGAALPAVGVMDMLRFHRFTEGRLWVDDYGSSDDPQQFKALLAYSPYHNIKPGTRYPATLITTADTDDRVVPGHSFKFAAALQRAQAGEAPILIRIETRAGHGGGKPTAKRLDETADLWAFLVKNLALTVP